MTRRAARSLPALLLAAGCVTRVVGTATRFPARPEWRSCVRTRLEGLGLTVSAGDTAAGAVRASGRHLRVSVLEDSVAPPDSATVPLRVELTGMDRTALVDTLLVYCAVPTLR